MTVEANAHSFAWADFDANGVADGPESERRPLLSAPPESVPELSCCAAIGCADHTAEAEEWWSCACQWWVRPCPCAMCRALAEEAAGWPAEAVAYARRRRPTPETRLRGIETESGEPGWCVGCSQEVPEGPDLCLGLLPVAFACCGHGLPLGTADMAYVAFLDDDPRDALYGQSALDWFAERGIGPPPPDSTADQAA
jgi:hypothetical protein